jgi:hypothetical protein
VPLEMRKALRRALERTVPVTRSGVTSYMPLLDAMAEFMVSQFADGTPREQMHFARVIMTEVLPIGTENEVDSMRSNEKPALFIQDLAQKSDLIEDGQSGYTEPPRSW